MQICNSIPSNYEYLMGTRLRECSLELRKDVNYSTIHMLLVAPALQALKAPLASTLALAM